MLRGRGALYAVTWSDESDEIEFSQYPSTGRKHYPLQALVHDRTPNTGQLVHIRITYEDSDMPLRYSGAYTSRTLN